MNKEELVLLGTGIIILGTALAKLIVGYAYDVPALIADGYHGLADAVIDLGGFFVVRASRMENVSGTRLRYFFSFIIAEFLIAAGILVAYEKFEEVPVRSLVPFITTVLVAITILISSLWRQAVAKETGSPVLEAEAMHGYSDVISTFGAMLGSLAPFYGRILSTIGVAIVVLVMIFAGIHIATESVKILVEYLPKDIVEIIKRNVPSGMRIAGIHVEEEGEKPVIYVVLEGTIHPANLKELEEKISKELPQYDVRIVARTPKRKLAIAIDENGNLSKFGEAYAFIIIDESGRRVVENPYRTEEKHRGVRAMRYLMELGVTDVCAKDFGEAVMSVFSGLVKMKKSDDVAECEKRAGFKR